MRFLIGPVTPYLPHPTSHTDTNPDTCTMRSLAEGRVAGGGGGKLKTGSHIHCKRGTPLANLWLTQLRALGIKRDKYADSTGIVSEIQA